MRWRGRRESSNVDDRRMTGNRGGFGGPRMSSRGGVRRAGIGGIGGLIAILLVSLVLGVNPLALLEGFDRGDPFSPSAPGGQGGGQSSVGGPGADDMRRFVAVVLADTEDTWNAAFPRELDTNYVEPELVLFTDTTRSACGFAQSATGPFYCPGDRKLYIDLAFYDELRRRFQAPGDFAQAYVIAHEVGHHVQNLVGILPRFNSIRGNLTRAQENEMSIRVELQADCFAGIWAHDSEQKGLLEQGDIEEALNAAAQIGDDMIQRRTQGYVVPESFNHGTSEQRVRWFRRGLQNGKLTDCDTFADGQL
ncbi:zinc metallopeptidase [Stappia sp. F7233]|uniref:Zinc metallopeptidase n=1 Tax=Stappia albiluteola TaxID=2758565 RepID=A0A839AFJ3_9HYPH|nr:neutral zinc metallopeptidase [Stappia albiluteola]MBA5777885.1 zinc metallopeptidase [Stappia albiluteola]